MWPFSAAEKPVPAIVPTDEVLPVHMFDDTVSLRQIIMVWTFKFDEVLDADKLAFALTLLFNKDGWRKLGGRWRSKADGGLEIHVPQAFSKERPAVYFTKEDHETSMTEHPLASKLPRPDGNLATYTDPKEFCSLGLGPDTPRTIDDYLHSDIPQFCLHVKTFTDGTLVSLSHSHMSADLMGIAALLEAWSLVLAGKPDAVTPFAGYRDDVFEEMLKDPPKEQHILASKILEGWRLVHWSLWTLYESWRATVEKRTICIPPETMASMMREAKSHIASEGGSGSGSSTFISEGDTLAAVACRMLARYQATGSNRIATTYMALDPRSRAKSYFKQDAAYLQNSPSAVFFMCPAKTAQEASLGQLALLIREAIQAQSTEEQIKAFAALSAESVKARRMPVTFGDKDMATQIMSNWTKGGLFEKMDFSSAIVKEATEDASVGRKRGRPSYMQATDPSMSSIEFVANLFVIVGKDFGGNTWISAALPRRMWPEMMEYLQSFS